MSQASHLYYVLSQLCPLLEPWVPPKGVGLWKTLFREGRWASQGHTVASHSTGMRLLARYLWQASTLPLEAIPLLAFIHQFQDGCGVCAWGFSLRGITVCVFCSSPQRPAWRNGWGEMEGRRARAILRSSRPCFLAPSTGRRVG